MFDPNKVKLGKNEALHDPATPLLHDFVNTRAAVETRGVQQRGLFRRPKSRATTYSITGPHAGPVGAAATFVLKFDKPWTGKVVVEATGSTRPTAYVLTIRNAAEGHFTISPHVPQVVTLLCFNSGGLVNPPAIQYTATAIPTPTPTPTPPNPTPTPTPTPPAPTPTPTPPTPPPTPTPTPTPPAPTPTPTPPVPPTPPDGPRPDPPASLDFTKAVKSWGVMGNDTVGDCTAATVGHMIQCWTTNVGKAFVPSDAAVLAMYSAVSGYTPSNPATDIGAVPEEILAYWRDTGIEGHKIDGFMAFDPKVKTDHEDCLDLFGGVYLGIQLPITAQAQTGPGRTWDVPPGGPHGNGAPGSWGGHAVPILAYDDSGVSVVTWGMVQKVSWAFIGTYCDEAFAVLSQDWVDAATHLSPDGFDYARLQAELKRF